MRVPVERGPLTQAVEQGVARIDLQADAVRGRNDRGPGRVPVATEEIRQEVRVRPIEKIRVATRFGNRLIDLDASEGREKDPVGTGLDDCAAQLAAFREYGRSRHRSEAFDQVPIAGPNAGSDTVRRKAEIE